MIEGVEPQIDGGAFPIKRIVGDRVVVEADIFADGHEVLAAVALYKPASEKPGRKRLCDSWITIAGRENFRWPRLEPYFYTVQAWVDSFQTWSRDFLKKYDAGQDVSVDLLIGAELIRSAAAGRAEATDAKKLTDFASELRQSSSQERMPCRSQSAAPNWPSLMARYPDRSAATTYPKESARHRRSRKSALQQLV